MIKTTITEFYTKDDSQKVPKEVEAPDLEIINDIGKPLTEELKEKHACVNCEHYKVYSGTYYTSETCTHPENTGYTYDHEGKHSYMIWEPRDKNKTLECDLFMQKVPFMQKIKIKLGFKKDEK